MIGTFAARDFRKEQLDFDFIKFQCVLFVLPREPVLLLLTLPPVATSWQIAALTTPPEPLPLLPPPMHTQVQLGVQQ